MSIYSNVNDQDLKNYRNIAEEQKNQRAFEIKSRKLKQTHDIELAENLSPVTQKLEEMKESTRKLSDIMKYSNSENKTPHLVFENPPTNQQIENGKSVIYDAELENTLKNMKTNTGFLKQMKTNNLVGYGMVVLLKY